MSKVKSITRPILTSEEYFQSIRDMGTEIWAFGEKNSEIADHPLFFPHVNAVAKTYELAPKVKSHISGKDISRFNHIHQSTDDLVKKAKMLRVLNQQTACCIQRCAGMDALNATYIVTYEIDQKYGTDYHERFNKFLSYVQDYNLVTIGAMTDVKGDRSKKSNEQADPDLFVHAIEEREDGIIVRGAKAHLTGVTGAHEMMVFPTENMKEASKDYALVFSCPVDTPGITYIFGRQTNDSRKLEKGDIDKGNAQYACVGGECIAIFDDVFIPWEDVYMYKEYEFAGMFVEAFATSHRQNYGACKGGICDVLIGATYGIAKANGVEKASHIKDKIGEMIHLSETLYASSIACSNEGRKTSSGAYIANTMLANVTKLNTTKFIYEVNRLAHDICGGILATLPSEADFIHPEIGPLLEKYLRGIPTISTNEKQRLLRLVETLSGGTASVEAMHGAGPPQAQKVMMLRDANLEAKLKLAQKIAGISKSEDTI
ncbi:4-hydroxybutyryl-CoA dehydratase [Alkalibaculum sp. M08DMB]|uniref:4-hydroxybutyryl-CoA dehydratase n=1 Tax=Alkalibaculum sporogenes TaxID=2655001 RepID=A0A6A7KAW9_9FIRM|nr:4-hydroxyphenylacetate 3-hydroxylase N-terminal domain-containing protein [Alkalibaculum sporogenes]MPW26546.1 4-hydroxybutyryl-CoA dehydratase [Alkalibaculum sporogenes]